MDQSKSTDVGVNLANLADFRIAAAEVLPSRCEICKDERVYRVQPRVMQVLVLLHSLQGKVATREELILHCWDGAAVTDDSITRVISHLRKLAKDLDGEAFSVRTIAKVGYALDAVKTGEEDGDGQGATPDQQAEPRQRSLKVAGMLAIPLLIVSLIFSVWQLGSQSGWTIGRVQQLNLEGEIQSHPAVSPDGQFIVYSASKGSDNRDLWMARAAGGASTRLTTHPDIDHQAAFSPSGNMLVFVRSTFADPTTPCRIILKDLSDLSETIVSRCKSASFRISTPAWSADEKSLYLSEAVTTAPDSVIRLVKLDLETGERTPLTEPREGIRGDYDPKISPDGRRLIFRRATDFRSGKHYLLNLADNSLVPLTEEGFFRVYTWTPDGEQIFLLAPDEGAGLTVFDSDGQFVEQRASGLLHPLLRMSRGGGLLAAEVLIQRSAIVDRSGNETSEISSVRNRQRLPTISSLGTLAFMTSDEKEATIWLIEDGKSAHRFVDLPLINALAWSPDGRELAYATAEGDRLGIVNVADEKRREMPWDRSTISSIAWAPDGQSLIFGAQKNDQWRLWNVPENFASQARQWSEEGWWAARSNSNAIFATRADQPGIWRMSRSGQPLERVETTFATGQSIGRTIEARNAFAVTDTHIYFHRNGADVGESGAIMSQPIAPTGSAITELELDQDFSEFSVVQDGRIVFVKQVRDHYIVTLGLDQQ
ncbi:MAG: winged helix-turn-helix domain-containing protein [Erythrobacter sp.]